MKQLHTNPEEFPPLITDPEFLQLMHPLTRPERNALRESLENTPLPYPVTAWKNICVDGQEGYHICLKKQLPYRIFQLDFPSRDQVISWICQKQLQKNGLPRERLCYLIGKRYETERKQPVLSSGSTLWPDFAQENSGAALPPNSPHQDFGADPPPDFIQWNIPSRTLTAERLGKEYGLAASTVVKYGVYARKIEILLEKDPSFTQKILSGKLKISHNNILELSRLPAERIQALSQRLATGNFTHLSYSALRQELQESAVLSHSQSISKSKILIKQKPKFNPDAGMESLIYTIPSWVNTMERIQEDTDFSIISNQAEEQLTRQIQKMQKAALSLLSRIQERAGNTFPADIC